MVFRAPGRVNLIGEHTDYNSGFVLPIAIQLETRVTVMPIDGRRVIVSSTNFNDRFEFDLDDPEPRPRGHWSDYVRGVAIQIERAGGQLRGASLEITSNIPIGAGLSSSAALEVATALALFANSEIAKGLTQVALLCQRAENEFVGARCGIMDQFVSCHGRAGHAILLDCRSLDAAYVPLPQGVSIVVCNTMVRHALASNEYNLRREQCEIGAKAFTRSLRDVSETDLVGYANALDPLIYRRCRHVITENQRVLDAAEALRVSDVERVGELMVRSHNSLRDDYEVSCKELDTMVALALALPGVMGARMTGGGFGGCTVNLVDSSCAESFATEIVAAYRRETGIASDVYICEASGGAS
jgi:galactokinase